MKRRGLLVPFILAAFSMGATWAQPQQPEPVPPPPESHSLLTPEEIRLYKDAWTLIEWTPIEVQSCPLLRGLRPAPSQDLLPAILKHVGETCTRLFQDFPNVSCDEAVTSEWRHAGVLDAAYGMGHDRFSATTYRLFRYIVIPHGDDPVPTFEEYRTDVDSNAYDGASLRRLPLITYDFASTLLYLSPADQVDSRFRYFGMQRLRDRKCHVLGFAQDPARVHRVNNFHFHGFQTENGALLLQGLAWIDSQTFQVYRIVTWLLAPRTDIGIRDEISTVDFYPVIPADSEKELWLPRDVTVDVDCRGICARNSHHYSNFELFRVESAIRP